MYEAKFNKYLGQFCCLKMSYLGFQNPKYSAAASWLI